MSLHTHKIKGLHENDFIMAAKLDRYGPPLHLIHQGPGQYDWAFLDEVAAEMQRLGIVPIMDLCHFGLPDWLQNFQNPEVPHALADYARAEPYRVFRRLLILEGWSHDQAYTPVFS